MSSVQRFIKAILPRTWGESMERESREWHAECVDCGEDLGSVWELGGIRWFAMGTPRVRMRCPACHGTSANLVRRWGSE